MIRVKNSLPALTKCEGDSLGILRAGSVQLEMMNFLMRWWCEFFCSRNKRKEIGGRELGGEVADFPLFFPVKAHHVGFCWKVSQTSVKPYVLCAAPHTGCGPSFGEARRLGGYDGTGVSPSLERGGFSGALAKQKKSKRNPSVTG